jgi:hypothetical protein
MMRSLGSMLAARQEKNGRRPVLGLIYEMRIRQLVKRFTVLQEGTRKHSGNGLVNDNGKPAWEDSPREGGHEFRRYVYEVLRYREQT